MQMWTLAALLILQCWMPLTMGDNSQYIDIGSFNSVGTVNFKGSSLRVFEIDGVQVAEPRVSFGSTCDSIWYNSLYLKYQLTLTIHIDVNTLKSPTDSSKKVGHVTLTGLKVKANKLLASKDAKLAMVAQVTKSGETQLMFMCDTFIRCQQVKDDVNGNPEGLWQALKFVPVGRVGGNSVRFGAIRSANPPKFSCNPGHWVVFQRRVDGSLSFAQNWDTYVKGFGNPKSNYWMGLDQLFAMTVTSKLSGDSQRFRCRLRVETEDLHGNKYWGEYKQFEVLGPDQNYRLRVGQEVSGSQMDRFVSIHNGQQFSTYDRDHDTYGDSCSQMYGYGGWWYINCHNMNLNGAYTTDKSIVSNPIYDTVYLAGKYVPMKRTLMKFRCD